MTEPSNATPPDLQPALIGRESELLQLRRRLSEAAQGQGTVTVLRGELGAGKTRLVDEMSGIAAELGYQVLRGQADAAAEKLPYGLFAGVLADCAAGSDAARQTVVQLVGQLAPHLWSTVFPDAPAPDEEEPADSPELRQSLLLARLVPMLTGLAQDRPVLVALEDLHWADSASLQAFQHLSQQVGGSSIDGASLVVVSAVRPEEGERGKAALVRRMLQELHRRESFHITDIGPLTQEQTRAQVASCFHREGLGGDVYEFLFRKSGGVPLFTMQYLEYLLERGVIYQDHGLWINRHLEEDDMPQSVRTAIRRRIEGLSEWERDLLSLAAVQGDRFEGTMLANSLSQPLERTLRELVALGRRTRLVKADGTAFRFAHPVLVESFYQLLPETKRRHCHLRLAYIIERDRPDQVGNLAHHLFRAGLYDRALPCLVQAARQSRDAHAYREARLLLNQAQGAADALNGNTPRDLELEILLLLADMEERLGDPGRCLELAEVVVRRADERLEKAPMAEALTLMGWVMARQQKWDDAARLYDRAQELYGALGDERNVAVVHLRKGNIAFERSDLETAAAAYRDAKATATKCDDWSLLGSIGGNLGVVATVRGDYVQAVLHYTEAIRAYSRIKHRYGISQTYHNLGMCHAAQREWKAALSCYTKGEELARELGTVDVLANLLVSRAQVHARRAELEEAEATRARAAQLMEQLGNLIGQAECLKVKGMVNRERGLLDSAADELQKGMAAFQVLENDLGVAECELELALVDQQQGDTTRARRRLQDSIRLFQQVGAAGDVERGEALLAEMAA